MDKTIFIRISLQFHSYSLDSQSSGGVYQDLILNHVYGYYLGLFLAFSQFRSQGPSSLPCVSQVYCCLTTISHLQTLEVCTSFAYVVQLRVRPKSIHLMQRLPYQSQQETLELLPRFLSFDLMMKILLSRRAALSSHSPFCKKHFLQNIPLYVTNTLPRHSDGGIPNNLG